MSGNVPYDTLNECLIGYVPGETETGEGYLHPRTTARTKKKPLVPSRVDAGETVTDTLCACESWEDFVNTLGMRFKPIPCGRFLMGSPENETGRDTDEILHEVHVTQSFYLQDTPVTQKQWEGVMGENPSHFKNGGPECPVESVSWDDCQEFIRRLNAQEGDAYYHLPTEAEWEYACRAATATAIYTGPLVIFGRNNAPALDAISWYAGNSGVDYQGGHESRWVEMQYPANLCGTHPVRRKAPNAWGLYDMLGNVWEWCQDWYSNNYYANAPLEDSQGPMTGSDRVYRGGSWHDSPTCIRSAHRYSFDPGIRSDDLGFRLARAP